MSTGPKVELQLSCYDCEYCKNSSYTCQSDSGTDVSCGAMNNRHIGDTNWNTPDWCPYRTAAIDTAIREMFPAKKELP